MTDGHVDVLVLTALKEELDALLQVTAAVREPWSSTGGDLPLHLAVLDGQVGPIRVVAARLTKMGGVATASHATRLIELVKPRCIAMCGVCAGHPEGTELGDVVIAERLFQHDEGKIRHDGFQGDLWVDALRDDWLRVAQDMAGPASALELYGAAAGDEWKWWFLEQLAAGRDPLRSGALRRYIPDERRPDLLQSLQRERLVRLQGKTFVLTKAGRTAFDEHRVLHGTLVTKYPFHIHVGPMGSGNAVVSDGAIWDRLPAGGMRKTLAVEMEAAAIGRVAHERGLPFAVVKGVMDHADRYKSDRFKDFAARAAAAVLCWFLRRVVASTGAPERQPKAPSVAQPSGPASTVGTGKEVGEGPTEQPAPANVFISYSHESRAHTERVTALADDLRRQGVDAWIDRYITAPPEGWPRWIRGRLVSADAVLVVCTATYRRRFEGDAEQDPTAPGKGIAWEGLLLSALLHGDRSRNHRFIPVLFDGATTDDIPVELRSTTLYRLPGDMGDLLRRLAGRPPIERPDVSAGTSGARAPGASARRKHPPRDEGEQAPTSSAMARSVQSEGVPEIVEEVPVPNPNPIPEPRVAMRSLNDFLVDRFTEGEIRQLAFCHGGNDVAAGLPGAPVSKEDLAWRMVEALLHRGLVDDAFFAELERQRAGLGKHIQALRKGFTGGASPGKIGKTGTRPAAPKPATEVPATQATSASTNTRPKKVAAATPATPLSTPVVIHSDSGHWSAGEVEARLAKVLESSEKLARSLDARLPTDKSKVKAKKTALLALHERVARRIIELKTGLGAARRLVEVCFSAVLAKDADAASERSIARELLCEWLPYGYPEVMQIVILRLENDPPDSRNLEIKTAREHFVEVHMARLDGRRCKFTRTRVDSRGGKSFAESHFPLPPGSSERRSADQVADLIVSVVGERFTARSKVDVKSRIAVEALKGRTPYVVVPALQRPRGFPDAAIRKLNKEFPELRVVILTDSAADGVSDDESMLWTMFVDLLNDEG